MRLQKNHFPVCSSSREIGTQPEESAPSGMFTAPASPDPRSRDPSSQGPCPITRSAPSSRDPCSQRPPDSLKDPAPSHTLLWPAQTPAPRDLFPTCTHHSGQPRRLLRDPQTPAPRDPPPRDPVPSSTVHHRSAPIPAPRDPRTQSPCPIACAGAGGRDGAEGLLSVLLPLH